MKHAVIVGMVLIILIGAFAVGPVSAATMVLNESRITTNTANQENPDIWEDRIVWQDNRNGNGDIYLYNVTTASETRITTDPANQTKPKIYGDHIVYMDNRSSGNWDIYVYDLETGTETPLANGSASQQNPAIYGNLVAWQDNRNGEWDIYSYDLGTHTETQITNSPSRGINWPPGARYENPAIYGDRIMYQETQIVDTCLFEFIYGIGLSGGYFYATNNVNGQAHPAIYGDRVVWVGTNNIDTYEMIGNQVIHTTTPVPNIFMKNILNSSHWNSTSRQPQQNPDIYGNYIVWQENKDSSPHDWDITIYDLDHQTESQVITNTAQQQNPAIYGNSIVYQDNRNGNWDIYLMQFGYVATLPGPGDNQTSPQGSLYVASYPSNATILINGTERGHTDQVVANITAGNVNLTLVRDGYTPYTTIVSVPAHGVNVLAPITLVKGGGTAESTGNLYVASVPTNATIQIDGVNYGKTNKFVASVPSGNRNLTLTKDGYEPYETIVNVPGGGLTVLPPITLSLASPPD